MFWYVCSLLQHEIAVVPILWVLYAFAQAVSLPEFPSPSLAHLTPITPFRISLRTVFSRKLALSFTQNEFATHHWAQKVLPYIPLLLHFYHYSSYPPLSALCRDHLFHLCVQETQPHQKWLREISLASIVIQQIYLLRLSYILDTLGYMANKYRPWPRGTYGQAEDRQSSG